MLKTQDSLSSMSLKEHNIFLKDQNNEIPLGEENRHPKLNTKISKMSNRPETTNLSKLGLKLSCDRI